MSRFAALFRRGHAPDIEALSAFVDGQLDADAARATEAHVTTCAMCATEVDGMRRVKAMLSAMPELDVPRSFRLRQADVQAPVRPARGAASGAMRWAPALSGVAAALFLVVLGTDFATRDGGGERQASLQTLGDSSAFERSSGETINANDGASESAADAPAGGAIEPSTGATAGDDGAAPATPICDADALVLGACKAADLDFAEPQPSDPDGSPRAGGIAPADDAATQQAAEVEAAMANNDGGDGNRTGFLVVEIIAAALAAGAAAAYIVSRAKRSEG